MEWVSAELVGKSIFLDVALWDILQGLGLKGHKKFVPVNLTRKFIILLNGKEKF